MSPSSSFIFSIILCIQENLISIFTDSKSASRISYIINLDVCFGFSKFWGHCIDHWDLLFCCLIVFRKFSSAFFTIDEYFVWVASWAKCARMGILAPIHPRNLWTPQFCLAGSYFCCKLHRFCNSSRRRRCYNPNIEKELALHPREFEELRLLLCEPPPVGHHVQILKLCHQHQTYILF